MIGDQSFYITKSGVVGFFRLLTYSIMVNCVISLRALSFHSRDFGLAPWREN